MRLSSSYFRNIVFGAEDSLVSTVGVLFGLAASGTSTDSVVLTGLIVITVEATSMGVGSFLSETSTIEQEMNRSQNYNPVTDGIVMFASYLLSGFIPLAPYIVFDNYLARFLSVFLTLAALFFLGYFPKRRIRSAVRMITVAGFAIFIGFIIATIFKI